MTSTAAIEAPATPGSALDSLGRLAAVASLTARETLRGRTMLIAVLLNLAYLGLLVLIGLTVSGGGLGDELGAVPQEAIVRFILSFGIAGAATIGLFIGIFGSVGAIGNEIERGTILAVAARPIERWEIFVGKFLGNGLLATLYLVIQGIAIGIVVALISGIWVNDLFVALALLCLNLFIVVAVALLGSTRLSTVANAIIVIVFYLAISNTGILYAIGTFLESDLLKDLADWARLLLPISQIDDQAKRILMGPLGALASSLEGGQLLLPARDWIWLYGVGYLAAVLALGGWSLSRRDLR